MAKEKKLPSPAVIAELFKAEHPILRWRENGYLRDGNVWRKSENRKLRWLACQLVDGLADRPVAQPRYIGDVIEAVADRTWIDGTQVPPFWLDSRDERDFLVVENGILNVRTGGLGPHDPMLFNLTAANFPFDPVATCSKTDKWFDWFTCSNQEMVDLLWEMCAYCLLPTMQLQRFFLLIGDGDNGKQVLLKLIAKLVGGNISALSLESLNERFAMAGMVGKSANLVADLNDVDKCAEGHLKMLCDGSEVPYEEKYKPGGTTVLDARLIFCANKMLRFRDNSDGLWRRLVLIPCNAVVSKAEKIHGYERTLYDEMPGVLNRVLEAAQRLIARGDFQLPDCCEKLAAQYRVEFDPAKEFCQTCIVLSEGDFSASIDVYEAYDGWCTGRRGKPVGFLNFWHTFAKVWRKEIDNKVIYHTKRMQCDREILCSGSRRGVKKTTHRAPGWAGIRWFNADYESEVLEAWNPPGEREKKDEAAICGIAPIQTPHSAAATVQPVVTSPVSDVEVDELLAALD
jgi:P4 family phage/plasmid primase-like protien